MVPASIILTGLFLRTWKEIFDPNKENMTIAPVCIRMYSLPTEYWKEEILMDIGNTLGNFIKVPSKLDRGKTFRMIEFTSTWTYLEIYRME